MTDRPGRILALDLGDARIGLAVSDPLGLTAQPAGFLQRTNLKNDLSRIRQFVREHDVVRIVVGYPLRLSGEPGARAARAEAFAERLRRSLHGVPVELWDERLTTAEAERLMISANVRRAKRRGALDSVAAVLILQSFMAARGTREAGSDT